MNLRDDMPKGLKSATPEPNDTKLKKEMLDVLRSRNADFEMELRVLRPALTASENVRLKLQRVAAAAEADAEALYGAIRVLAEHVSNEGVPGRKAREEARNLLESRKITPPHTLGASRVRKSKP